jgi:uncharacterized protein DUF5642
MIRAALAIGCVCWLTACTSATHTSTSPTADIGKIGEVKDSFGPEFHVTSVAPTGIDPKLLTAQKLPDGLKFQPADCAKFATAQGVPPGVQGNMAAVVAEGDGNRFIAIAVQTSKPVQFSDPGPGCQKVGFGGGPVRGLVEVVDVPQIAGTRTLGVHRVVQTVIDGKPSGGEIYDYSAHFGDYQVIVTANSVLVADKPILPVNTQRARELLSTAVTAVRAG